VVGIFTVADGRYQEIQGRNRHVPPFLKVTVSAFSFSGTQDSRSLLCDKQSAHSNDNHRIGKSIRPSA
jgi:hypothetical protein